MTVHNIAISGIASYYGHFLPDGLLGCRGGADRHRAQKGPARRSESWMPSKMGVPIMNPAATMDLVSDISSGCVPAPYHLPPDFVLRPEMRSGPVLISPNRKCFAPTMAGLTYEKGFTQTG